MFWVVQKVSVASIFLSELEFLFEGFQKMLKYQKLTSYTRLLQEIGSGRRVVSMKRMSIRFLDEILVGTNIVKSLLPGHAIVRHLTEGLGQLQLIGFI